MIDKNKNTCYGLLDKSNGPVGGSMIQQLKYNPTEEETRKRRWALKKNKCRGPYKPLS